MKRKPEHVLLPHVYTNFEDWKVAEKMVEEQQKETRKCKKKKKKRLIAAVLDIKSSVA